MDIAMQEYFLQNRGVWLKELFIPYTLIRQGKFPEEASNDEIQALHFCQDWLNDASTFSIRTSGSTGLPKTIQITREQMTISAMFTGKALDLQAGDTALVNLNTRYIGGMMMLVRGFVLDLQLSIISPVMLPLQDIPVSAHYDFLSFVPMQLQATMEKSPDKISILNKAKAILLGGAPVSTLLNKQVQHITAPVYQTYGMTETLSHIALKRLNGTQKQEYYTTLKGIKVNVDERNCLIIYTPFTASEPLITNDIVEVLSDNTFIWMGRIDNVINTGGVKVQAEKVEKVVEEVLLEIGMHCRFFVGALPHPRLGETVTLFVEKNYLLPAQEVELLHKAAACLSRFEKPTSVICIPEFLETPTGKIDKINTLQLLH